MKYQIFELKQIESLQGRNLYENTIQRSVLERPTWYSLQEHFDSIEDALKVIKKEKEVTQFMKLTILPIIMFDCNGEIN